LQDVSVHNAEIKSWVSSESKGSAVGRDLEAFHRSREAQADVNQKMRMYWRLQYNEDYISSQELMIIFGFYI
jgi:hypothetical protein